MMPTHSMATCIQVYNIWHSKLYDELYQDVPPDNLKDIVMFGVNEDYTKEYTKNRYNVMFEYELPVYNSKLQQHGYCQTTCMWHLWKNKEITYKAPGQKVDYIGFMQYDMKPESDFFTDMREAIAKAQSEGKDIIFHEQTEHILQSVQFLSGLALPYERSALQHYNQHFGTAFTTYDFLHNHRIQVMPLVHTFVISVARFEKMMGWIEKYLEFLENIYPDYVSNRSQSELLERCHGMFLALECANNDVILHPMLVKHIWPLYHDKTDFKNYKTIV